MNPTEQKIYDHVSACNNSGICCSFREIQKLIASTSTAGTIAILEKMRGTGLIIWEERKQRTIRVAKLGVPPTQFPLYQLAETTPLQPLPEPRQTISLDRQLVPYKKSEYVVLRVSATAKPSPYFSTGDMLLVETAKITMLDHTQICLYRVNGALHCYEVVAETTVKNTLQTKKGHFITLNDIFGVLVRVYGAPRSGA